MSKLFEKRAILFDMDGVLVDSEPIWKNSEIEALSSYGIDFYELYEKYGIQTKGLRIDQAVDLYCRLVPEKNIFREGLINEIINRVIDGIMTQKPTLAGVNEALALCKEQGLKIGLASSSPMNIINTVTETLNITHFFDVRVSAEFLAYGKPHPDVYLLAAKKIGVDPLHCITVEDSITGMVATKAARMTSIVVPAEEDRHLQQWCLADYQLCSLLELTRSHFS